jgi:hypothetical protein
MDSLLVRCLGIVPGTVRGAAKDYRSTSPQLTSFRIAANIAKLPGLLRR